MDNFSILHPITGEPLDPNRPFNFLKGDYYDAFDYKMEYGVEINESMTFVADGESLDLLNQSVNEDMPYSDSEFTLEFVDLPIVAKCESADNEIIIRAYIRDDDHGNDIQILNAEIDKSTGDGPVYTDENNPGLQYGLYIETCLCLSRYIQLENLDAEYQSADWYYDAILLESDHGKLNHKLVRGSERPDVQFLNISEGETSPEYGRAYPDEIIAGMQDPDDDTDDDFGEFGYVEDIISEAENGDEESINIVAEGYMHGAFGFPKNPERAAEWTKKSADLKEPVAYFNLGLMYATGFGVTKDLNEAVKYLGMAEACGDMDAPEVIEVIKDGIEAAKGAEAGDPEAVAELAFFYNKMGRIFEQHDTLADFAKSKELATEAARSKVPMAYYCLGLYYENEAAGDVDLDLAMKYYRKGAEAGHAPSQWNLAVMLLNGLAGPDRANEGKEWAIKAAKQGYELAVSQMQYIL